MDEKEREFYFQKLEGSLKALLAERNKNPEDKMRAEIVRCMAMGFVAGFLDAVERKPIADLLIQVVRWGDAEEGAK